MAALQAAIAGHGERLCLIEDGELYRYRDLLAAVAGQGAQLEARGIAPGAVVALAGDFRFGAVATLLALWERGCTVALLSPNAPDPMRLCAICGAVGLFDYSAGGEGVYRGCAPVAPPALLQGRQDGEQPGFIVFSSGSTGEPKAVLHDAGRFLATKQGAAKALVTLAFLMFDHIAGLDTLLYTLFAGGCLVTPGDRSPAVVCDLIRRYHVEVLPVSPTFLNLLCLSDRAVPEALASVRVVTYGSEPMSEATLARVGRLFPHARIEQKYGTSEFGSPRTRSRARGELWLQLDAAETSVRVEDGILWVRHPATMVGYLNAEPPAMRDGYLCTGDRVVERDGWLKILGRASDLINVGGEKVYPQEVQATLLEIDGVLDAVVSGQENPLLGQVVVARVQVPDASEVKELRRAILGHCLRSLERYKVPVRLDFTEASLKTERHKIRR